MRFHAARPAATADPKHERLLTAVNLPFKQKVLGIPVEVASRLKPAAQIFRASGGSRPLTDSLVYIFLPARAGINIEQQVTGADGVASPALAQLCRAGGMNALIPLCVG